MPTQDLRPDYKILNLQNTQNNKKKQKKVNKLINDTPR